MRLAKRTGDAIASGFWQSQVQRSKATRLNRLLNRSVNFASALDKVVSIPGLRYGLTFTALYDCGALHCNEVSSYTANVLFYDLLLTTKELLCYLGRTYQTWLGIIGNDVNLPWVIDRQSVEALESRCPSLLKEDLAALQPLMDNGSLFPSVIEPTLRSSIWSNILDVKFLIPTCNTFCRDRQMLKQITQPIFRLLKGENDHNQYLLRETLRSCLTHSDSSQDYRVPVQVSESRIKFYTGGDVIHLFNVAILQMVLFAMRHVSTLGHDKTQRTRETPSRRASPIELRKVFSLVANSLGVVNKSAKFSDLSHHDTTVYRDVAAYLHEDPISTGPQVISLSSRSGFQIKSAIERQRSVLFLPRFVSSQADAIDDLSGLVISTFFYAFWGDILDLVRFENLLFSSEEDIPIELCSLNRSKALAILQLEERAVVAESALRDEKIQREVAVAETERQSESQEECVQVLVDQATAMTTENRMLTEQFKALPTTHQQLLHENALLEAAYKEAVGLTEDLKTTIADVKDRRLAPSLGVADSETQTESTGCPLRELEDELNVARQCREELECNILQFEQTHQRTTSRLETLESELNRCESMLKQQQTVNGHLKKENDDLRESQRRSESNITLLKSSLEEAQTASKTSLAEVQRYQKTTAAMARKISRLEEDNSTLLFGQGGTNRTSPQTQMGRGLSPGGDSKTLIHFYSLQEDSSRTFSRTSSMSSDELFRQLNKGMREGIFPMSDTGRGMTAEHACQLVRGGENVILEGTMTKGTLLASKKRKSVGTKGAQGGQVQPIMEVVTTTLS